MISLQSPESTPAEAGAVVHGSPAFRATLVVFALLPLHTLILCVLYGVVGLPSSVITVVSAWKEVVVAGLVAVTGVAALRHSRVGLRSRWMAADIAVGYFAVWLVAVAAAGMAGGSDLSVTGQLYGLRFYAVPLLAYALGRWTSVRDVDLSSLITLLLWTCAATSALAVIERLFPDGVWLSVLDAVGYRAYFGEHVGFDLYGPQETLPALWSPSGDNLIRRVGSVYLVSKPFALTFLLLLPIAVIHAFRDEGPRRHLARAAAALGAVALVLSLTRAVIVVVAVLLVGVLGLRHRRVALVLGGLLIALAFAGLGLRTGPGEIPPGDAGSWAARATGTDDSGMSHERAWARVLDLTSLRPVTGLGLGVANEDTSRVDDSSSPLVTAGGSENVYIQVLAELGVVGLVLYLAVLVLVLAGAVRLRRQNLRGRTLADVLIFTSAGFAVVGLTTPVWTGSFLATYVFWWLAGQVVRRASSARPDVPDTVPAP